MKIYTKTGDKGETGLMGGKRLSKDSLRIRAYGEIDELNAVLGVCGAVNVHSNYSGYSDVNNKIHQLQLELFDLGADLATPLDEKFEVPRVSQQQIDQLEQWIDEMDAKLPPLKNFILPEGSEVVTQLHVARTVCRRAERSIVELQNTEAIGELVVVFVNRLSDFLFVLARLVNMLEGGKEELWGKDV